MTSIKFPANPTLDQVFTFGNKSWKWNGVVWRVHVPDSVLTSYQVAVANGFVGTEAEWLETLVGPPGTGFIFATFPGAIGPLDSKPRWSPPKTVSLTNLALQIDVAPSIEIVFDIKRNGLSIFSTNHPKLPVGQNKSNTAIPNVEILTTDYITLDILIGNGSDLTARIDYI